MKIFNHPNLDNISLSTVMLALADSGRLKIVQALMKERNREFSCKEFNLGVSKSTVSHHFETLRSSGIIQTRSAGTKNLSSLREEELNQRFPGLLDLIAAES